ncbi:hypothetical protein F5Y12DRAFT_795368 [Xylaria sp. FL1777]|nr:hypothetical protein F5Y12DRAFT_795368 [Xylaria sp. FL1777]
MASPQSAEQNSPPTKAKARAIFKPRWDHPAVAEAHVYQIFKQRPNNLDLVAAELAPLFGFGAASNHDVLARSRSQAVFASQILQEPFGEFAILFLKGEWSLPTPKWDSTLAIVKEHAEDKAWRGEKCPLPDTASVDEFCARALIRTMYLLKNPEKHLRMLDWLRNAEEDDDVYWVFFFSLAYLQLEAMHFNKSHALFRDLVSHYVNKIKGLGSIFDEIYRLMALRRVKG